MDILQIMEQFGIPVAVAMAFGFFIWRQNKFIQSTLMQELDQDFKRLEGIIIKLIDQKKVEWLMNKVKQFKIETPIGSVESDTDNHLIDVGSVVMVVIAFYIMTKLLRKWLK